MEGRNVNLLWAGCRVPQELTITRAFSMFNIKYEKKFSFVGELHDSWELFYVRKGRASVTADERIYTLDEGCIILHKPLEFHKFETLEDGTEFFVTAFNMEGALTPLLYNCSCRLSSKDKKQLDALIDFWIEKFGHISHQSSRENVCLTFKDHAFTSYFFKTLETIFLSIIQYEKKEAVLKEQNSIYKQLVTLIESRVYSNISIGEMAEAVGVSEATVRNVFQKSAGCGAHKYLLKIKIREAINLIRQGKSISETSDILGFNNPNYFTIVFKRETGKTPSEYK